MTKTEKTDLYLKNKCCDVDIVAFSGPSNLDYFERKDFRELRPLTMRSSTEINHFYLVSKTKFDVVTGRKVIAMSLYFHAKFLQNTGILCLATNPLKTYMLEMVFVNKTQIEIDLIQYLIKQPHTSKGASVFLFCIG